MSLRCSVNTSGTTTSITIATLVWSELPPGESISFVIDNGFGQTDSRVLTNTGGVQDLSGFGSFVATADATTGLSVVRSC